MWTAISVALSVAVSICSVILAIHAVRTARARMESPGRAISSLKSQTDSTETRVTELEAALEVLANRVKMQRVRTAVNHVREPEPPLNGANVKDELRKRAGLVAGKPARHQ